MADSFAHNTQFVGAMNGSECSLSYVVHTEMYRGPGYLVERLVYILAPQARGSTEYSTKLLPMQRKSNEFIHFAVSMTPRLSNHVRTIEVHGTLMKERECVVCLLDGCVLLLGGREIDDFHSRETPL